MCATLSNWNSFTKTLATFLMGLCIPVFAIAAEWDEKTASFEFSRAARQHHFALSGLMKSRGIAQRVRPLDVSIEETAIALRNNFPSGTALVLYEQVQDSLNIWAITPSMLAWERPMASAQDVSASINRLRVAILMEERRHDRMPLKRGTILRDAPAVAEKIVDLSTAVNRLSTLLLPADISHAIAQDDVKHVVIVPTAGIGTVPFPLLDLNNGEKLVDRLSVTLAPSLGDLFQSAPTQYMRPGSAFVIGNPQYDDSDYVLPDLPGAATEASNVARILKTKALLGKAATFSHVSADVQNADIIYLATHGVASEDHPLDDSFVALTPVNGKAGRWTARQIQHSPLHAQLAVLSACQTGLGQSHDAGIIGLGRAFQLAGVKQVLMSLWNIEDQATARIMEDFMHLYIEGTAAPEALRLASLAAKQRGAPPSKWAPFVILAGPFPFQ